MKDFTKFFGSVLLILVLLLVVGWGTSWFGLVTERPMAKYQEETRTQTYENSRQYQQGTNLDIVRYCEQMRDQTKPLSSRKAVAALIRSTASTYQGDLTPDAIDCVNEAKGM